LSGFPFGSVRDLNSRSDITLPRLLDYACCDLVSDGFNGQLRATGFRAEQLLVSSAQPGRPSG
jgi:hypothetical protein